MRPMLMTKRDSLEIGSRIVGSAGRPRRRAQGSAGCGASCKARAQVHRGRLLSAQGQARRVALAGLSGRLRCCVHLVPGTKKSSKNSSLPPSTPTNIHSRATSYAAGAGAPCCNGPIHHGHTLCLLGSRLAGLLPERWARGLHRARRCAPLGAAPVHACGCRRRARALHAAAACRCGHRFAPAALPRG